MKFNRGSCPECLSFKKKNKGGKASKANFEKWNQSWVQKVKKTPTTGSFSWHTHNGERVNELLIKELRGMSDSHCAFCDKYAPENDSDSIEHFYPKKLKPKMAFNWENLFLCCAGCQKRPKNWKDYMHKTSLVLKPDAEDYSFERFFIFNTKNGKINVNQWNDSELDKERAEVTIVYFKLNGFKRPQVRLNNFRRFYDSREPNKITKSINMTLSELPYRFIYLN